jgi:hypothetical protein
VVKRFLFIHIGLFLAAGLISSCSAPTRITVHDIRQIEKAVDAEKVIFIFDTTGHSGRYFQEYFLETFTRLTQGTPKRLSIMTGYEYARSPYSQAGDEGSLDDALFILVKIDNTEQGDYDTCVVNFLMTVQYQGQEPLLLEEITLGFANPYLETGNWRGHELATVIYEELNKRSIL